MPARRQVSTVPARVLDTVANTVTAFDRHDGYTDRPCGPPQQDGRRHDTGDQQEQDDGPGRWFTGHVELQSERCQSSGAFQYIGAAGPVNTGFPPVAQRPCDAREQHSLLHIGNDGIDPVTEARMLRQSLFDKDNVESGQVLLDFRLHTTTHG